MRLARFSISAKALALALATGAVVACLAPLIGESFEERSALWVVTDRALVRVGLDTDGTHRTTDPVPGAATAEVRVRGNRLITARESAITSHALTPTLQPGEGTTAAMDVAPVSGLAVSSDAERIWLARPAPRSDKASADRRGHGRTTRVTGFTQELVPQWQQQLPGRVTALAAASDDAGDVVVWALQARQLVGLDATGTIIATLALPPGPPARAFVPLAGQRVAVADVRGVRLFDNAGQLLTNQRLIGTRALHPVTSEDSPGFLWAHGRHRLTLLDEQLQPVRDWRLPAQGLGHPVAVGTVDPRDGSLWFVSGYSLYNAAADGTLTEHRDLFAYLGTDPVTDLALYADTFAPELTVTEPAQPLTTNNDQPDLVLEYDDTGIGVDTNTLNVKRDGEPVDGACETDTEKQRIECVIGPFDDGTHTVTATIADYAGNESEAAEAVFEIDTVAPEITVESPADGAFVNADAVSVRGSLSETAELTIDGESIGLHLDNRFEHLVTLDNEGSLSIELKATDGAGNRAIQTITVTRDTVVPPTVVTDGVSVEADEEAGNVRVTGPDGSVEAEAEVIITNTRTGDTIVVQANADGAFSTTIAGAISDTYEVVVRDAAGNESEPKSVTGVDVDVPSDPIDIAPPLPETGTPPFEEQISFLYKGDNAIQQDVEPGTIEARRVSVLRGEVRNRAGEPLPGVRITVLNHPELGHTATQADGEFDLAVNGGGYLTIAYSKDGYLPVQRTVTTQWNGWYHADNVVMIPLDDRVTQIDLTDTNQLFQIARGSVVSDADGTRQATVLFPTGTTAEITLPNGTKKQLSELDVRATEYTVGDTGPAAMPGELPSASAYTYAVELSVDQAIEQGVKVQGKGVVFNQPVPVYVDNFLGFPIGELVPIGYYDRGASAWIPHPNGRILEVLDEHGGLAVLDVAGEGKAASQQQLDALDISDAERATIADLYRTGDSVWRFTTTHLSTWDANLPYGPPMESGPPDTNEPDSDKSDEPEDDDKEDCKEGCIIRPQTQSLGESIEVAGTSFSINYYSDRAPGAADNKVTVQVTGSEVPDTLKGAILEITVAGKTMVREFSSDQDQDYEYVWDGRDAYGRALHGGHEARIKLTYVYPCEYYAANRRGAAFAKWGYSTDEFSQIGTRARCQGFKFPRESRVILESPFPPERAISNWSLSIEHHFERFRNHLERGDGKRRTLDSGVISTIAGNGIKSDAGDGAFAEDALVHKPMETLYSPDGSIYIADFGNHRVRKITPDGIMEAVAGTGAVGYSGDGGLAVDAELSDPRGLGLGPDGSLYIADSGNQVIRRVSPDGIITTVAGNGDQRYSGDGVLATETSLWQPRDVAITPDGVMYIADRTNSRVRRVGLDGIIETVASRVPNPDGIGDGLPAEEANVFYPVAVAVGPDGSLYIQEAFGRIRRVTPDGIINTVAGDSSQLVSNTGYEGDGGPASEALFSQARGMAVGDDGSVYISDTQNNAIRRIAPDGVIRTIAGNGVEGFSGDDGLATNAMLSRPREVGISPSGELVFGDFGNSRIRRIGGAIVIFDGENMLVPSENGAQVFVFSSGGVHLRTIDAYTGGILYAFERNVDGHLVSIIDQDGRVTVIERDSDGDATAIVSPDGQRTGLSITSDNHLQSVTKPDGSIWSMDYSEDGLLLRFEKPGGTVSAFSYDASGRLLEDVDPNGGGWKLSRANFDNGYITEMISGEGRLYRFSVEHLGRFARVYTEEAPGGVITKRTYSGVTTKIESADGSVVRTTKAPDPRFGFLASYDSELQIETPSGLILQQETGRIAELSNQAEPMTVEQWADTVSINGRTRVIDYDATLQKWSATSPEGRVAVVFVDGQSRPLEQAVPGIEPIHIDYDERGRVDVIYQGSGVEERTTAFSYHSTGDQAGYLASITDALDRTVSLKTDAIGRVTEQALPDGRSIGYQYDGRGNLIALTPPGRDAHVFQYDGLDQRTDYTPPDLDGAGTVTRYTYNLDRQIREIQRPGGELVTFDYDTGGRLAARHMPAGDTTYGYDATTGQLATIDAPGGIGLQFQWDGFLPTQTDWTGPVSGSVSRAFDNNFWLTQETVNGNPVSFGYDNDGLLTDAGTLELARDSDNGIITGTTQADIAGSRGYNAFGELADRVVAADGATVYDVEYTRDKLGRITQKAETLDGETHAWAYDYDLAGRLTEVSRDGTPVHLYDYDANGNRASHTGPAGTRTGTYDAQDRITSYGDVTYTHTEAGERATKTDSSGTTAYDYDAAGNLKAVTLSDGTEIEYLIDGQDRRIGKIVDGALQKGWLYRDQLNPVAQLDADGNVTHRFVYGDKPNVPAYMIKGDTAYRIVSDHLGSVRLVIDTDTNEIVQRMDYSPFGEVIADSNPEFQPFGFAGGLYDRDAGLVRFGARDHDPEIGRWTAKDPILFEGDSANLFGYAVNDPVNHVDPNGKAAVTTLILAGAGAVLIIRSAYESIVEFIEYLCEGLSASKAAGAAGRQGDMEEYLKQVSKAKKLQLRAAVAGARVALSLPGNTATGPVPTSRGDVIAGGTITQVQNMSQSGSGASGSQGEECPCQWE